MAKTLCPSVLNPRFEVFTIPFLMDFVDGDRGEMLLCSISPKEVLEQDQTVASHLCLLISDPRRGCYIVLPVFIYLFIYFIYLFFFPPLLSGPYLWNRYSQRLQIECAAWSYGLILHYSLPSNSLRYFFFFFFFPPRFCRRDISGTVTRRDSRLSVLLGPAV